MKQVHEIYLMTMGCADCMLLGYANQCILGDAFCTHCSGDCLLCQTLKVVKSMLHVCVQSLDSSLLLSSYRCRADSEVLSPDAADRLQNTVQDLSDALRTILCLYLLTVLQVLLWKC